MARILVINPNCSARLLGGDRRGDRAVPLPGRAGVEVATLAEGPPAIYAWRDWHAVVDPLCRLIEREPADAYVIACASDPGIEAARAVDATGRCSACSVRRSQRRWRGRNGSA